MSMDFYNELFTAEAELAKLEAQLIKKREHIAILNFLIAVISDLPNDQ